MTSRKRGHTHLIDVALFGTDGPFNFSQTEARRDKFWVIVAAATGLSILGSSYPMQGVLRAWLVTLGTRASKFK